MKNHDTTIMPEELSGEETILYQTRVGGRLVTHVPNLAKVLNWTNDLYFGKIIRYKVIDPKDYTRYLINKGLISL